MFFLLLEKRREMKTRGACLTVSGYRKAEVWLKLVALASLWIVLPVAAQAQSSLVFPRLLTPAELSSTGFAVVNSGATAATVTFTLYGDSGAAVSSSTQTVAAGGQL